MSALEKTPPEFYDAAHRVSDQSPTDERGLIRDGIQIETHLTYRSLGEIVAAADSEKQVQFIDGMLSQLTRWKNPGAIQGAATQVEWIYRELKQNRESSFQMVELIIETFRDIIKDPEYVERPLSVSINSEDETND